MPKPDLPILQAWAASSHRHAAGDARVSGTVARVGDGGSRRLPPGAAVGRSAGVASGPCLRHDGADPATWLVFRTRFSDVAVHVHAIEHFSRRNRLRMQSRKDGTPCPGWPKETNR